MTLTAWQSLKPLAMRTVDVEFAGVLDAHATGLAAAFATERLLASYEGPAIRVRRASDNAEQDIGFATDGTLDTDALLAFAGAGNAYVVTWYDQSGSSRHVSQATTTMQPQIVNAGAVMTDAFGNIGAFGSARQQLGPTAFTHAQPAHRFAVLQFDDRGTAGDGNTVNANSLTLQSNLYDVRLFAGTGLFHVNPSRPTLVPRLIETLANGASSSVWVADQAASSGNAGASSPAGVTLFSLANNATNRHKGYISAWLEYAGNQSANRDGIRAALKNTYICANEGISIAHKTTGMNAAKTLLIDDTGEYEAWPYGNAFYDAAREQIALFYTSGTSHVADDKETFFRAMDPDTDTVGPRVLISTATAATIHGACMDSNGDYLAFVRSGTHATPALFQANQWRSTDGGATWIDEGVVQADGQTMNVIHGPVRLSTSTIIAFVRDTTGTNMQCMIRSTDNGSSWAGIMLDGAEDCLEGAFAEDANGFIICVIRTDVEQPKFTYSEDDGLTWAPLQGFIQNGNYQEMLSNPSAILYHPEDDIFEAFVGSRKAASGDGLGSIFQTTTTPHSAKYGTWADDTRIQTMEGNTTSFGADCGYPAAVRVANSVYLFWYDIPAAGDGTDTNIYYVKGSR